MPMKNNYILVTICIKNIIYFLSSYLITNQYKFLILNNLSIDNLKKIKNYSNSNELYINSIRLKDHQNIKILEYR